MLSSRGYGHGYERQRLPESAFRRYLANQWIAAENYWLPPGAWQACAGEPVFEDGERIVVGVDIGGERSDSAVVWVNDRLHVGCEILSGDRAVLEIPAIVRELAERYSVIECTFDPWRAAAVAQERLTSGSRCPACRLPRKRGRAWQRLRQLVFARFGRTCWRCGAIATDIDHLVRIADGGTDSLANLRPACARCNRGRR